MTEDRLPLAELLQKSGEDDFLRAVAESVLQIIMEADVEGLIGAGRHERSGDRTTWRNGYSRSNAGDAAWPLEPQGSEAAHRLLPSRPSWSRASRWRRRWWR